jgi:hypothetical protein
VVHPADLVDAGFELVHEPHNVVAAVRLEMLFPPHPKPGFRAGEYAVGIERDLFRVIPHPGVSVIPIGRLDDDLAFGIHRFGGSNDEVLRDLAHRFETVLRPGFVAFALYVVSGRKLPIFFQDGV